MARIYSATIIWFLISYLTTFCLYSQCNQIINQKDQETEWQAWNERSLNQIRSKAEMVFLEKRNVPFNSLLGTASINVPAYSNGDDSFFSGKSNYLYGVYMGVKWQCVEYSRRWLFIRKGCTFADIDSADDMWYKLNYVERVVDGKHFALKTYPNGSPTTPKAESFIIYERNSKLPFGHVAVIVDVVPGYISVAEQNYYYYYWSNSYARKIPLVYKNGRYYIEDFYRIYGWMEVQDNNKQLKPLDATTIKIIAARNGVSV